MRRTTPNFILKCCGVLLSCWFIACSPGVAPQAQTKIKTPPKKCSDSVLWSQIDEIARPAGSPVGVAISLIGSGETILLNAQDHFPMQSVYKLPIGMAVLHQIDQGKLTLHDRILIKPYEYVRPGQHSLIRDRHPQGVILSLSEILRLAVSESDGTASDVLMRLAGGPDVVMKYLQDLGVDGILVIDTEKQIGKSVEVQYRNWASPEAALALLKVVAAGRGLSSESHKFLLRLIIETPTGPNRIKGLLPAGTVVAHKTGTGGRQGLITRAVNDIGLVTLPDGKRFAIAVFVSDTKLDIEASERIIAKISRAAWDCFTITSTDPAKQGSQEE